MLENKEKIFFISDIHLASEFSATTTCFMKFLQHLPDDLSHLYILGDLFDSWIGDDDLGPYPLTIIAALKEVVKRGVNVYLLSGNRDFLLGKKFADLIGGKILTDPTVITHFNQRVLITHGDALCLDDINYQRARKFLRHHLLQTLFLTLPLVWRRYAAQKLRAKSSQAIQQKSLKMMDVNDEEVIRIMQAENVRTLIHGHTHHPAKHQLKIADDLAYRIVLGAWHEAGSALEWTGTNEFRYLEF